jgi:hypothetical protein
MADNVTGSIGSSSVLLENAATEATLQLLLKATLATTAEQKKAINDLVQKAGIDPATVQQANQELNKLGQASSAVGGALAGLDAGADKLNKVFQSTSSIVGQLTSGAGQASNVFGVIAGMGGVIGLVGAGFQKLAQFQEEQLKNYQSLTNSGISFGGSLTEMRLAASNMYLTMDQFTNLVKNSGEAFAKMGGSTGEGMEAFKKASISLMNSGAGKNLQALGYTSEQVNQSMINYIAMTGGRSRAEMANTTALATSTAAYLEQLDGLAQLTGKSREEQEKALKEANQNAAIQQKMATMSEEQKAAYNRGLAEMQSKFGKAGTDLYQAQILGIAPQTAAAQQLMALAPAVARASQGMADVAKAGGKASDTMKFSAEATAGARKAAEGFGDGLKAAMSTASGPTADAINSLGIASAKATQQGIETAEDELKIRKTISEDQEKRQKAEAAEAVATQRAVQQLGQEILTKLMPVFSVLLKALNGVVEIAGSLFKALDKIPYAFEALGVVVAGLTVKYLYQKAAMGVSGAAGIGSAVGGAAGAKGAGNLAGLAGGEGAGKALKGVAGGLKAFSNPKVLVGATFFGAAITIIGAGIAGAAWILGKALPTLAEGLMGFNEMNGKNLGEVGMGMVQLGAGLVAFGAGGAIAGVGGIVGSLAEGLGSLFGAKSPLEKMMEFAKVGPELKLAGEGIGSFNTNLAKLLNTDMANIKNLSGNLTNLAGSLKELREASKPVEKSFLASAADALKSALTPETTKAPAAGTAGAQVANRTDADKKESTNSTLKSDVQESLRIEVAKLNSTSMELLRAMRESAENTKRTASILASRGNLLKG